MIKRVLLVQPFGVEDVYDLEQVNLGGVPVEAPLGLGYIAAFLKKRIPEIEVEVYDANGYAVKHILANQKVDMTALWRIFLDKIRDFKPDVVGVSCLFHKLADMAHDTIEKVKNVKPDCITVMGGNYPTSSAEYVLQDRNLDYVILSEGDFSFTDLILALNGGKDPIAHVDGIAYFDKERNFRSRPKDRMIENLNDIPAPMRTHFHMDLYESARHFVRRTKGRKNVRFATMTASRGCPFKCTFCSTINFWGQTMRYRNPREVVDEMRMMKDDYGINCFCFNDDNMLAYQKDILALLDAIIAAKLDITWVSGGGMQTSALTPKVIEALYKSGCNQFNLAIESGSEETLRRIKKPLRGADTAQKVIKTIREMGDGWICSNFITGFPFETQEDIRGTLDFCQTLDLDWKCIYVFNPLPGTEDYKYAMEKNYVRPFELRRRGGGAGTLILNTENFSNEWLANENYFVNLKTNFIENRNLYSNTEQAIRDFTYVIEMVPDHAIAYYSRGAAHARLGHTGLAKADYQKAQALVRESRKVEKNVLRHAMSVISAELRWFEYFETFNVDIDMKLRELDSCAV